MNTPPSLSFTRRQFLRGARAIAAQAKTDDYKLTTLVESLTLNELFQKR